MPRPVGIASHDELLIVELDRPEPPGQVRELLAPQMPEGIVLGGATDVPDGPMPRPLSAVYRVELGSPGQVFSADDTAPSAPPSAAAQRGQVVSIDQVAERIRTILSADRFEVQRIRRKRSQPQSVDLRAWLIDLDLKQSTLTATLRITPEGSVRPAELLETLGLNPIEMAHRMTRIAVRWEGLDLTGTAPPEPDRPAYAGKDMNRGKETNQQATDR